MLRSRRTRRSTCAVLLACLLLTLDAGEAAAHAGLVESEPAAGATLGAAPDAIRLTFSEPVEAKLATVSVSSGDKAIPGTGTPVAGPGANTVVQPLRKLGRGVYKVTWRIVSADDGHATSGFYSFGVQQSPGAAAASETSDNLG